jgi:hypothetical protein
MESFQLYRKVIMRKLLCLFVLTSSIAFSQSTVKKDLFYLFNKIPPLPTHSNEAYGKGLRDGTDDPKYAYATDLFDPFFAETQKLKMETTHFAGFKIEGIENPEELSKKMEKMNDEERMKAAMEMAKGMQVGVREIHESPEVMNAVREFSELNSLLAQEQMNDLRYRQQDRMGPLSKRFSEMDARTNKVLCENFPSYCEEGGQTSFSDERRKADNAGAFRMLLQNWNEKNTLLDKELIAIRSELAKRAAQWKTRLGPFNSALRNANFGADAKDQTSIQALSSGQQQILGGMDELAQSSNQIWTYSAALYGQKIELEKRLAESQRK